MTAAAERAPAARNGGCLCGAVRYRVTGFVRPVVACHCTQCRRTSGHHVTATSVRHEGIEVADPQGALTWYRSSDTARRGFCGVCGSNLFWQGDGLNRMSIMAGTLDDPSGLKMVAHIYIDSKGDYYEIGDGLPQHEGSPDESMFEV